MNIHGDPERNLDKEMRAAQSLKQSLAASMGEDVETMRDMIEGETDLHDCIAGVMGAITEDEILVRGIGLMMTQLEARKHRIEERIGRCRAAIEQAMVIGELQTLQLPEATISLKKAPPALEIIDEAAIPYEYWTPRDPALNKSAIKDALKNGTQVPGATLGNGSLTLAIRRQ